MTRVFVLYRDFFVCTGEEKNKMTNTAQNGYLETQKLGKLICKYSLPCIISLLVGALYNIVDQIYIANAEYLGSYGNAANSVVFPMTVIALAAATMIGDGTSAFFSMTLGARQDEKAAKSIGNAIVMTVLSSVVVTAVYLVFADVRSAGKRRNICFVKGIFLLDKPRHTFLYVRSGNEPDNTFRRKSSFCNAVAAS